MNKIILITILVFSSMSIFSKETPEHKFWKWFSENESKIYASENANTPILNELSNKLSEYKDGIVYEITVENEGKRELVISADGIKETFPNVISLYKSSPKLKRWKIIAFRPRMEEFSSIKLTYQGKEFDPNKIWIYPIIKDGSFDLIIYHPEYTEENKNLIISGIYILLDTALGEYDVVTGIRYLDFYKVPKDPKSEGLKPFIELRKIFDEFNSKMANK